MRKNVNQNDYNAEENVSALAPLTLAEIKSSQEFFYLCSRYCMLSVFAPSQFLPHYDYIAYLSYQYQNNNFINTLKFKVVLCPELFTIPCSVTSINLHKIIKLFVSN